MNVVNRFLGRFGYGGGAYGGSYDALKPRGKRRRPSANVHREDAEARGQRRTDLQANAADLARNFSLAAWMVRRHLDYVSDFSFHGRNESDELNEQLQRLMLEDSRPHVADVSGRFSREKIFRLAETRRVFDGDTFLVKLRDMRLQGLQADLIKNPRDRIGNDEEWINGVRVNEVGRHLEYSVYQRKGYSDVNYLRKLPARNVITHGFYDRYASDQVRGYSPLIAALNPLRDVYENFDFALAKAKVSQLFALAFYQDSDDPVLANDEIHTNVRPADDDADHVEEQRGFEAFVSSDLRYVDLNPGEKAEIIESNQPSTQFQNFTELVIQVALKALDIPYSFYDEAHTNFFGSRAAWLHYERSCIDKRNDQVEMRRKYTVWKIAGWIKNGRLVLPAGMTQNDLLWEWVPRGMPWWDPAKEIRGYTAAIAAGLDNPQRICRSTGTDYYENIDKIAKATEYAEERGVQLSYESTTPDQPEAADDDGNQESQ